MDGGRIGHMIGSVMAAFMLASVLKSPIEADLQTERALSTIDDKCTSLVLKHNGNNREDPQIWPAIEGCRRAFYESGIYPSVEGMGADLGHKSTPEENRYYEKYAACLQEGYGC